MVRQCSCAQGIPYPQGVEVHQEQSLGLGPKWAVNRENSYALMLPGSLEQGGSGQPE